MDLKRSFSYFLVHIIVLRTSLIKGMHIPLFIKEQGVGNESVASLVNENKPKVDVAKFSGDIGSQFTGGIKQNKANGVELVAPTTRNKGIEMKSVERYKEPWELNYNVCPPSLCTANEEQRPTGKGGSIFYDGDIVLDKESERIIYGNKTRHRYTRATTRNSRTWRNAIVPYMFASNISPLSASLLSKAMRTIEKETCIRFRRRQFRDEDYIRFISEPGCWSAVGRVGGEQKVSLGPECERVGIAIHEILHALGCWHEQARPDRDEYVEIITENIAPKYVPDFKKANKVLVTSRGFPYDYESVMHYGNKAFTNLGNDTIKVIGIGRKLKMRIGQRDALSNIDIAQLRDMYQCYSKENRFNTYCAKYWVRIGGKCYKFEDKQIKTFPEAVRKCKEMNSTLLVTDDATEEFNIKRYVKKMYPKVKVWRTGERTMNRTFAMYTGNWNKSRSATYSSLAMAYNKKKDRLFSEGMWISSYRAYAFICEQKARRKCIYGEFPDGRDYRGTLDHTIDGYTCQKWSSQYPWAHKLLPFPYDGTKNEQDGLGDHNYCRNPLCDRKSRPWCYTTKSKFKWQYCDVSICSKNGDDASYRKNNGSPSQSNTRKSNKIYSTNLRRITYKSIPRTRNPVKQQQSYRKASSNLNRKQKNLNMRTNKMPVNRNFSSGKRSPNKGRKSSLRRSFKSNRKPRRRKHIINRQNKIGKF